MNLKSKAGELIDAFVALSDETAMLNRKIYDDSMEFYTNVINDLGNILDEGLGEIVKGKMPANDEPILTKNYYIGMIALNAEVFILLHSERIIVKITFKPPFKCDYFEKVGYNLSGKYISISEYGFSRSPRITLCPDKDIFEISFYFEK